MSEEIVELENRTGYFEQVMSSATECAKVRCASFKVKKSRLLAEISDLQLQQTKSLNHFHCVTATTTTTSADSSAWELKVNLMKAIEEKSWVEVLGEKEIEIENAEFDIIDSEGQVEHFTLDDQLAAQLNDEQHQVSSSSIYKRKFESPVVAAQAGLCRAREEIHEKMREKMNNHFKKESQAKSQRAQKLEMCKVKIASLQESHFVEFGIRL
jgi:hypothetical protein